MTARDPRRRDARRARRRPAGRRCRRSTCPRRASRRATRSGSSRPRRREPSAQVKAPVRAQPALVDPDQRADASPGRGDHGHGEGDRPRRRRARRSRPRSTGRTPRATRSRARTRRSGPGRSRRPATASTSPRRSRSTRPATTPTASRSRRATRSRASRPRARRSPRRRSCAATPAITTQISAQETAPGAQITDSVVVTGLGKLGATVNVELWGPFPTREAIRCEGTPFWTGTFPAAGDGTYTTAPVTLTAGRLLHLPRVDRGDRGATTRVITACGEVSETTLAKAAPKVTTVVSDAVVKPDGADLRPLTVTRPRQDAGDGRGRALRPVRVTGGHRLRGRAVLEGRGRGHRRRRRTARRRRPSGAPASTSSASGSRRPRPSPPRRASARSRPRPRSPRRRSSAAAATSVAYVAQGERRPVARPSSARLGIDAPVARDRDRPEVRRARHPGRTSSASAGGATAPRPATSAGTILLAGHVDSAKDGAGAFYALKSARRGDVVTAAAGRQDAALPRHGTRRVRKAALPSSIYTRTGPREARARDLRRAVRRRAGHYRDNVIVTAVPLNR